MKRLLLQMISGTIAMLVLVVSFNYYVDPFFHYRKPRAYLAYPIELQRYQNNGILKHYDYNAIIGGTSMTENFKPSLLDDLFEVNSVKVSISGTSAAYKEMNQQVEVAYRCGKDLRMVVRSVDYEGLLNDKDKMVYLEDEYPKYLYNDNIFDDFKYLLNKSVTMNSFSVILNTLAGNKTTSLDDYSYTANEFVYSKESVNYIRRSKTNHINKFNDEDYKKLSDNIIQNFIQIAINHPETQFYYYYTPYSICYFDEMNNLGELEKRIDCEIRATELFLNYNNIHIFSFFDRTDYITNVNNYRDIYHYNYDMNDYILKSMKEGMHCITKDNKDDYYKWMKDYYLNFDYDKYFLEY